VTRTTPRRSRHGEQRRLLGRLARRAKGKSRCDAAADDAGLLGLDRRFPPAACLGFGDDLLRSRAPFASRRCLAPMILRRARQARQLGARWHTRQLGGAGEHGRAGWVVPRPGEKAGPGEDHKPDEGRTSEPSSRLLGRRPGFRRRRENGPGEDETVRHQSRGGGAELCCGEGIVFGGLCEPTAALRGTVLRPLCPR
jgi:hypothetical protein